MERHLPRHLSCWTVRGTHQGEVEEFGPSTGRQVEIKGITIHRIEDGKIVEEWEGYDNLSILQQLGLAPEQLDRADTTSCLTGRGVEQPRPSFLPSCTNLVEHALQAVDETSP